MCNDNNGLQPTRGDNLHTLERAGLSAIPIVGGSTEEIFSAIIVPPMTRRRDDWIQEIVTRLEELEQMFDNLDLGSLSTNDVFITVITQATQSALRNHSAEKLSALRNAVLNSALPNGIDDEIQQIFIALVDSLTPLHLRILKFFDNPRAWGIRSGISFPNWSMGGPATALEYAIQELRGQRNLYDPIVKDLYNRGLNGIEQLHTTMSGHGILESRTTQLGKQFIRYISSPIDTKCDFT